jgi:Asp-tRNA(Asn)/Glu-tRNA(Gln) amidotransferase A subunit family amidase
MQNRMAAHPSRVPLLAVAVAVAALLLADAPGGAAGQRPPATGSGTPAQPLPPLEVAEATVSELQQAMADGRVTSVQLVDAYLARIDAYDQKGPRLNAVVRLNPNARTEAAALDRERAQRGARGPLHGIPVILKDNYDVAGMPTTAGALALAGLMPAADAFQVRKLREAGAVILGKTNLHELASGITTISSLGGQTLNPYDPTRNPGGSSGGTGAAVAAGYAAVGWGSDTCGSIRIPAAHNNLFGLRPTKGLSSVAGILPLSHTQDVGGPLARTVTDLAIALDATVGADPADPATNVLEGRPLPRFADALRGATLTGARIGVLDAYFGTDPADSVAGSVVRAALARMDELGAALVPFEVPQLDSLSRGTSVIDMEFKWDLADYLAAAADSPVDSLGDIIALGVLHEALVATMNRRNMPTERDSEAYRTALARQRALRDSVVAALDRAGLDWIAYPTVRRPPTRVGEAQPGSTCSLSATTGLPALSMPAGFAPGGLPVGVELLGRPLDDARLVAFAYAYEQGVQPRRAPPTTPPLSGAAASAPGRRFTVTAAGPGLMPGPTSRARAQASFSLDRLAQTLAYDVTVTGVPAEDVFAVVVRREVEDPAAQPRWRVVERLSGPGVLRAAGTWTLTAAMLERLDRGELYLEVFTRQNPAGEARARLGG